MNVKSEEGVINGYEIFSGFYEPYFFKKFPVVF